MPTFHLDYFLQSYLSSDIPRVIMYGTGAEAAEKKMISFAQAKKKERGECTWPTHRQLVCMHLSS